MEIELKEKSKNNYLKTILPVLCLVLTLVLGLTSCNQIDYKSEVEKLKEQVKNSSEISSDDPNTHTKTDESTIEGLDSTTGNQSSKPTDTNDIQVTKPLKFSEPFKHEGLTIYIPYGWESTEIETSKIWYEPGVDRTDAYAISMITDTLLTLDEKYAGEEISDADLAIYYDAWESSIRQSSNAHHELINSEIAGRSELNILGRPARYIYFYSDFAIGKIAVASLIMNHDESIYNFVFAKPSGDLSQMKNDLETFIKTLETGVSN